MVVEATCPLCGHTQEIIMPTRHGAYRCRQCRKDVPARDVITGCPQMPFEAYEEGSKEG